MFELYLFPGDPDVARPTRERIKDPPKLQADCKAEGW